MCHPQSVLKAALRLFLVKYTGDREDSKLGFTWVGSGIAQALREEVGLYAVCTSNIMIKQ